MGAERTVSLDATLRHVGRRAEVEVSAYANRMAGYIHLYPSQEPTVTIRGVFPTFTFRQTDAFLRGLDGLAAYRLGTPAARSLRVARARDGPGGGRPPALHARRPCGR